MDHVVEEVSAGTGLGHPPEVAVDFEAVLKLRVRLAHHGAQPDLGGTADRSLSQQLLGQLKGWVVAEALADPQDHTGLVGGCRHRPGFGDGVGQWLLARDMLAGFHCSQHVVMVEERWGEDLYGVDLGVGQQVGQIGIGAVDTPGTGGLGGPTLLGIAHSHHVAPGVFEIAGNIERGNVPSPHDSDPRPGDQCGGGRHGGQATAAHWSCAGCVVVTVLHRLPRLARRGSVYAARP